MILQGRALRDGALCLTANVPALVHARRSCHPQQAHCSPTTARDNAAAAYCRSIRCVCRLRRGACGSLNQRLQPAQPEPPGGEPAARAMATAIPLVDLSAFTAPGAAAVDGGAGRAAAAAVLGAAFEREGVAGLVGHGVPAATVAAAHAAYAALFALPAEVKAPLAGAFMARDALGAARLSPRRTHAASGTGFRAGTRQTKTAENARGAGRLCHAPRGYSPGAAADGPARREAFAVRRSPLPLCTAAMPHAVPTRTPPCHADADTAVPLHHPSASIDAPVRNGRAEPRLSGDSHSTHVGAGVVDAGAEGRLGSGRPVLRQRAAPALVRYLPRSCFSRLYLTRILRRIGVSAK